MRVKHYWLFFFLMLGLLSFFFYQWNQPHLSYPLAETFDGNDYQQAYQYFTGQQADYLVPPPFHKRILIPFLASRAKRGIIEDFQLINLIFSLFSIWITFVLWRRLGIELKWMLFGFIWLLFHWTGMIRLNAFDPITVDVALYFFQALLLWIIIERRFFWLLLLAPLATAQKESFIGIMIILSLYALWHNHKEKDGYYNIGIILISTALSLLALITIEHYFPPSYEGRGAFIMLAYQMKQTLLNPFKLVRWIGAVSMAFGPLLWLALFHYKKHFYLENRRNLLAILTLVSLGYGLLAGGDSTRIIFLGFPFIMTFALSETQNSTSKIQVISLLSLPLMMLPFTIPDPAYAWDAWLQWYPEFAQEAVVCIVLFYTIAAALFIKNKQANKGL
jgi:hypothetical protein